MQEESAELDEKRAAVAKVLGEPFMLEFTDPVRKMRTHLMIGSSVGLAVVFMGLKVNQNATLMGIQLEGLTEGKVLLGLLLFNLYLLIHFLWSSADSFVEWRLRLTGTRLAHVTVAKLGSGSADYPSDPRQSTLYCWWKESAKEMVHIPNTLAQIDTQLTQVMADVAAKLAPAQTPEWIRIQILNQGILSQLGEVRQTLAKTSEVLEDARIPISLERFDRRFYFYQKSQTYRWILVEWLIPTLMAASAIGFLIHRYLGAI